MKKSGAHFNVVLRPEPEGGFTAIAPALPGCVAYGRTLTEAKSMAKDAISRYIESLRKHNETVPDFRPRDGSDSVGVRMTTVFVTS